MYLVQIEQNVNNICGPVVKVMLKSSFVSLYFIVLTNGAGGKFYFLLLLFYLLTKLSTVYFSLMSSISTGS